MAVLFSCAAWWGEPAGFAPAVRAAALVMSGLVPLAIQLVTGHGLDVRWVARFGRAEKPRQYLVSLVVSLAVALALAWVAYRFLIAPVSAAAA